ncbi:hypothetical protein DY000_02013043 [Brassica cretica]|uniref:FBD domain-containing protein n=1 Tax=Brassica cretica TaxID=69181 RepID=A0ABQ7D0F8_BRACR|nr:hypothetical protein DY000_02013043 [Brassica cretica]
MVYVREYLSSNNFVFPQFKSLCFELQQLKDICFAGKQTQASRDLCPNLRVNSITVVVLCDFSPAASQWRPRCRERRNTIPIRRIFVCVVADEESPIRRRLWRRGEGLKRIAGDDEGAARV